MIDMKNFLFAFCLLLGGAFSLSAQDIITTKDGTDIQARILEVTMDEVKYKRFSYLDGPSFVMPKSQILIIRYENGETSVFSDYNTGSSYSPYASEAVVPGMSYREYSHLYDHHYYVPQPGDPYSRFWTGFASLIIPGLGQAIEGEWTRGLAILAANVGLALVQHTNVEYDSYGYIYDPGTLFWMAGAARVVLNVWNIFDAVHIAKVKNMYYQDLRAMRAGLDFKLEPYFAYAPTGGNTLRPTAGLSLKLSF